MIIDLISEHTQNRPTSHISIHSPSSRPVRMPMAVRVTVSSMTMSMSSMAMFCTSMPVPVVRVGVVMPRAATFGGPMGVCMTEGTDAHQINEESTNRHRL